MFLGYMLTYYSVQYTFPTACATLALHGLAFALVYATAIHSAQVLARQQDLGRTLIEA